jgi:hypothetical protein
MVELSDPGESEGTDMIQDSGMENTRYVLATNLQNELTVMLQVDRLIKH